jgi:hypothetical protein
MILNKNYGTKEIRSKTNLLEGANYSADKRIRNRLKRV